MSEILAHIVLVHLAIVGIHEVTRDGMLFGFVERFWQSRHYPDYADPITECKYCMPSVWGAIYLTFAVFEVAGNIGQIITLCIYAIFAIVGLQVYGNNYQDD